MHFLCFEYINAMKICGVYTVFGDLSTHSLKRRQQGEKKRKNTMEIVATNVIASQMSERQPTVALTTRNKKNCYVIILKFLWGWASVTS